MSESVRLDSATLDYVASAARHAAKGISDRCPEGRYALGAVTALLEFASAIDPPDGLAPTSAPCKPPHSPSPLALISAAAIDAAPAAPDLGCSPAPADSLSIFEAHLKGYTGDCCPDCGSMSMVRNGMCLKCDACGATTGCS